jgi:uncharacterized protein YcbX
MNITVGGLFCYPVKSCRGIALRVAEIGRMGIRYDRQWMVVDDEGRFVAQRADASAGVAVKSMCLIDTAIDGDTLRLSARDMPELALALAGRAGAEAKVSVWGHACVGVDQGTAAAGWMSAYLSRERPGRYRLLRMPDDGVRRPSRGVGALAFADGYSFLITSQASLNDLNQRIPAPLPMLRFRPNIVLGGCEAYAEDRIARLGIGGVEFIGATRCTRCAITTTDPVTGARGKEPLATLATYRREEGSVTFGRNFNHAGQGRIALGDPVEAIAWD